MTNNKQKSGIRRPTQFQVLGHGFVSSYEKGAKGKFQLVVSDKSMDKLKRELKTITRKTSPMSFDERIQKLKQLQRGWLNYFRLANMTSKLQRIDAWVRNRLRYCIWRPDSYREEKART